MSNIFSNSHKLVYIYTLKSINFHILIASSIKGLMIVSKKRECNSSGDRSHDCKSSGNRSHGGKSSGDRSCGCRSLGNRSCGCKSSGNQSHDSKSFEEPSGVILILSKIGVGTPNIRIYFNGRFQTGVFLGIVANNVVINVRGVVSYISITSITAVDVGVVVPCKVKRKSKFKCRKKHS